MVTDVTSFLASYLEHPDRTPNDNESDDLGTLSSQAQPTTTLLLVLSSEVVLYLHCLVPYVRGYHLSNAMRYRCR